MLTQKSGDMGVQDRDSDGLDSVLRDGLKKNLVSQYDATDAWLNIKAHIEAQRITSLNVSDRVLADLGLTRDYKPSHSVLPVEWFLYRPALLIR